MPGIWQAWFSYADELAKANHGLGKFASAVRAVFIIDPTVAR
jgi:hypothetical protein